MFSDQLGISFHVTDGAESCSGQTSSGPGDAEIAGDLTVVEGEGEVDGCEEGLQPQDEGFDFCTREEKLVCFCADANYVAFSGEG